MITKQEWKDWARYCVILFLAGLTVVIVSCRVMRQPTPNSKIYPPGLAAVRSNQVQRLTAQPQAAIVAPSEPPQAWIEWEEPEDASIIGYVVSGSKTSSTNLTLIWSGARTNRAPAKDFLYFELRSFSMDVEQKGIPAVALRPLVYRSNTVPSRTNIFVISFVPAYWKTNRQGTTSGLSLLRYTNLVEASTDLTNWFLVQRVFGCNRTNVLDRTTSSVRYYRVRAI